MVAVCCVCAGCVFSVATVLPDPARIQTHRQRHVVRRPSTQPAIGLASTLHVVTTGSTPTRLSCNICNPTNLGGPESWDSRGSREFRAKSVVTHGNSRESRISVGRG